jgi:hypothetical protein
MALHACNLSTQDDSLRPAWGLDSETLSQDPLPPKKERKYTVLELISL